MINLLKPICELGNQPMIIKETIEKNWWEKFIERGTYYSPNTDKESLILKGSRILFIKFVGISYWLFLFIALSGMLFYIAGNKKAIKYTTGSIIAYIIVQAIESVI